MSLIWFSWDIHNGWSDSKDHLIQLPIIRLIVSGRANVMVFFVISGYALSWKPLSLLQGDQQVKMYQGMASSIFRRHPRLFIPAIIICAPAPVIAYLGGYSRGEGMPGAAIQPMNPPRFDTIWEQFSHYARTLTGVSDMYTPNGSSWAYSDSLWTLPIEFKSSLVLFGLLIALSQCTTRARVVITSCVAIYTLWFFHWGEFLFIGGMLIVDVSLLCQPSSNVGNGRLDEDEDGLEVQRRRRPWPAPLRNRTTQRLCSSIALLAALFVLSMPEQGRGAADSWGFGTLVVLMPAHFQASGASDYFWQPLAAVLLVLVIDRARWLQRIFVTQLAQYLGRVSFALYLVHMLILHSLGFWLGKCFLELTGSESDWEYGTGVGMAAVVVGCVIIYAADLGSRFVDANAVRFTAWAYTRLRRHND
jgi:peptidoglycan/LPS O-acetylase OafA/YrhL